MQIIIYTTMIVSLLALIFVSFRWRYYVNKVLQKERMFNEQLQQSEIKSRRQFKSIPIPTYTWKKEADDFILTDFNDIVFNETEGKVQHLLGITASKLLVHNTEIIEDMHKCLETANTIKKEIKYYIKETDQYKYYNVSYAFVPADSVIVHMEDTTARKLLEIEIKENEVKYRTLYNTITYAILLVNNKGEILESNETAIQMFAYTTEELKRINLSEIIAIPSEKSEPQNTISYPEKFIFNLITKSAVDGYTEIMCTKKNKETFPAEIQIQFMKVADKSIMLLFIGDISERKAHQIEVQRYSDDLEKANQDLKTFTYIISHDLKAPLRAINSLIEWLSTDYADKFDETGKDMVKMLVNRTNRMHELIESIIRYAKIGKVDVVYEDIDLAELIKNTANFLLIPENITITMPQGNTFIRVPVLYLQQIIQNLVSNAVKFIDKPQGEIKIGCEEHKKEYQFWVTDNGSGIEAQHFDKIFQLFQTLHPKDEYDSTGIGLSIVKKIVDNYKGKIWIESTVGIGSTFYFTLPKEKYI